MSHNVLRSANISRSRDVLVEVPALVEEAAHARHRRNIPQPDLGQWEYRVFEKAIIVLIIVGFYRCLSCVFFWGILSDKNKFWTDNWSV